MTDSDDAFEDEIIEIFVEEVTEVVDLIDVNVQLWEKSLVVDRPLKELRRAFHTLKGSGRMVNADAIGELGWAVENLLNRVIDGLVASNTEVVTLVQDVRTALPALLDAFKNRQAAAVSGVNVHTYIERANALMEGGAVNDNPVRVQVQESPAPLDNIRSSLPSPATKPVVNSVTEAGVAELKSQQKDLTESLAAVKLDLSQFTSKVDDVAREVQTLSSAASEHSAVEVAEKLQQIEQLRSEVSDLQYFVNSNSKQLAADNLAQQELARTVNRSIEDAQKQQQIQLNQLRLEVKTWSVSAAIVCSVLVSTVLFFLI